MSGAAGGPGRRRVPLYARVLRLRHVELDSWQRAVFVEGSLALAVVLVLADLASAWTLLALPLAVAAVVKLHDVLTGAVLGGAPSRPGAPERVSRAARR